ncbi:DUF551 domain-containing protein [Klebsiella pneumoniae]|uniref:DUF551 domain-containing protein n=1 Tax=Klebsiella pneumoniae TaxID=573 RepID=UPI001EE820C5|nr:DUF551 domain-containing protein [Klebsiella pneumoniae]MCG5574298.1 DUF551 domain-containing protein [Klebsiella pneumoniae]
MTKSAITRERLEWLSQISCRDDIEDIGGDEIRELASMALAAMDSESGCLPLDYLQGHKDGLEWAAQLAEANHPETGDWLYDDPIELAKAIRKGPDMPPAQQAADSEPVAYIDKQWTLVYYVPPMSMGLKIGDKLYRHAQPAPVVLDGYVMVPKEMTDEIGEAIAMQANCCGGIALDIYDAILAAAPQSPGSEPATVPGKWIPVREQMPPSRHEVLVGRWWGERPRWCCKWATYIPGHPDSQSSGWLIPGASWTPTHWMPLPAAPQGVIHG